MVKFAHTIFAMPFAIVGYFLGVLYAGVGFSWKTLLLVILCMVFARNSAMGFNRYIDRFIDARNPRTLQRELPAGLITPGFALIFVIVNAVVFVVLCKMLNTLVFYLSALALSVIFGYSLAKKFTSFCHFILGLALSFAPIGAYLAVTGVFDILPVLFSLLVLFWVSGFDIIYSLQDKDFDVREGLFSIPAWLGLRGALLIAKFAHTITGFLVVFIGFYTDFGIWYVIGAAIFIFLLIYQHLIVKHDDLSRVDAAFFRYNGIAAIVFAVFTVLDLFANLN